MSDADAVRALLRDRSISSVARNEVRLVAALDKAVEALENSARFATDLYVDECGHGFSPPENCPNEHCPERKDNEYLAAHRTTLRTIREILEGKA